MPEYLNVGAVGVNIASSIAGAILLLGAQWIWDSVSKRRGTLSGEWRQLVFASGEAGGTPQKEDVVKCWQRGDIVTADIQRLLPENQANRSWRFSGRFREGVIFGHFWALSSGNLSYGTIFLRRAEKGSYTGFYIRSQQIMQRWKEAKIEITAIPIEWRRRSTAAS